MYVPYAAPDVAIEIQGVAPGVGNRYSIGYDGVYTVAWSTSGVVGNITVEESENGGATWVALVPGPGNTASRDKPDNYTDGPVDYLYRIQACNADACSGVKTITASVLNYRPGGPGTVSLLSGPRADGSFTLQWGASTGPELTHYVVQERELGASQWGAAINVGNTLTYAVSGKSACSVNL